MKIGIPIGPEETKYLINSAYISYIAGAGYSPILIVPENKAQEMAKMCDGLLLPGGRDIDPIYYGENNRSSFWCDPDKDDFERKLLWAFMGEGKPVFGICRGFQLIAREYLYHTGIEPLAKNTSKTIDDRLAFVQDVSGHSMAERFNLFRRAPHHYVDARIDLLYGEESKGIHALAINSMHHQCLYVDLKPDRLERSAKTTKHMTLMAWTDRGVEAEDDGVVAEAFVIESWTSSSITAVQWHPEELKDYPLLQHAFRSKGSISSAGTGFIQYR